MVDVRLGNTSRSSECVFCLVCSEAVRGPSLELGKNKREMAESVSHWMWGATIKPTYGFNACPEPSGNNPVASDHYSVPMALRTLMMKSNRSKLTALGVKPESVKEKTNGQMNRCLPENGQEEIGKLERRVRMDCPTPRQPAAVAALLTG